MTLLLSHRRLVNAVALGLVVSMAGLGAAACQPKPSGTTVTIASTAFSPTDVTVTAGQTVTWVNNDPFPHTVTSTSGVFDSHSIDAGASWSYTPTTPGDFPYICTFHPNMKATLHVK